MAPATQAYHSIWIDGVQLNLDDAANKDFVDPLYGKQYLPRKFKLAIGLPGDNSVDVYVNDIGLLAICENYKVVGYNLLVGGSFGVTPSAKKTFPAVAVPMMLAWQIFRRNASAGAWRR